MEGPIGPNVRYISAKEIKYNIYMYISWNDCIIASHLLVTGEILYVNK